MTILLNQMPFSNKTSEVAVRGERVLVKANQIIIWVSLGHQRLGVPNPAATPFPAIGGHFRRNGEYR